MGNLAIHLSILSPKGSVDQFVSSDLEAVLSYWESEGTGAVAGILHVGFDFLNFDLTEPLPETNTRLFLTYAAAATLSGVMLIGHSLLTRIGPHAFYECLMLRNPGDQDIELRLPEWIKALRDQHVDLWTKLHEAKIWGEDEYFSREHLLDLEDRQTIAKFRFDFLTAGNKRIGFQEMVKAAPPWLIHRSIYDLDLPVRIHNVVSHLDFNVVGDLREISKNELLAYENIGRKSVRGLDVAVLKCFQQGPGPVTDLTSPAPASPR